MKKDYFGKECIMGIRRRTREEIKADLDARIKQFREDKTKKERGEPLDVVQKSFSGRRSIYPKEFKIHPDLIPYMSPEELVKEQERIDDLNRRLKIHREHMAAISRNHANDKCFEDRLLTKEESKWLQEDDFFVRKHPSFTSKTEEEERIEKQHYKEDFMLWLKTDAGKRFLENISEHDMQWMRDNCTEEELVECFGTDILNQ